MQMTRELEIKTLARNIVADQGALKLTEASIREKKDRLAFLLLAEGEDKYQVEAEDGGVACSVSVLSQKRETIQKMQLLALGVDTGIIQQATKVATWTEVRVAAKKDKAEKGEDAPEGE